MRRLEIVHQFVETIPDDPAEGILYISMTGAKAVHRCCCGCGAVVATPIGRGGSNWRLAFDGLSISLEPAIDDWTLECGSHYRIRRNQVKWLTRFSQLTVETGQYSAR